MPGSRILVRRLACFLIGCALLCLTAEHSSAQLTTTCITDSGQRLRVPVYFTHTGDIARSRAAPISRIFVDPQFQKLSPAAKHLILSHECHHAMHTYINEDQADVYAGKLMYLSGYSRELTMKAAHEVFSKGTTYGHSIPAVRIASIMSGFDEAARDSRSNAITSAMRLQPDADSSPQPSPDH